MTRVFFISVWIALLATFSCRQTPISYTATLLQIERFVAAEPDSAYSCLQALDTTRLSCAELALYYLIRTETEDKLYIEHTTDSLIGLARIYFESVQDIPHLAKAWYLTGRIHSDWKDWEAATQDFLKARELTEHSTDYALQARIASYQGGVNWDNYLYKEAQLYFKEAYDYYSLDADSVGMASSLREMGNVCGVMHKIDSAIFYYKKALSIAETTKNKRIVCALYRALGFIYKRTQQYEKANDYLRRAIENSVKEPYAAYVDMGDSFMQMGQLDSARIYLQFGLAASFLPTRCMANYYLGELAHQEGELDEAYRYKKQYELLADSLDKQKRPEVVVQSQQQYGQKKIVQKYQSVLTRKNFILTGLVILALLAAAFIYYLAKRIAREKERQILYEQEIQHLSETIQKNENVILQMEAGREEKSLTETQIQTIYQLADENQQMLIQINKTYIAFCQKDSFLKKLYDKSTLLPAYSDTEWTSFVLAFESVYSQFIPNLQKEHPDMSLQDVRICALSIMKLKISRIADIMNLQSSTLSSYKQRIKKNYFNIEEKKPLEDFLLKYIL